MADEVPRGGTRAWRARMPRAAMDADFEHLGVAAAGDRASSARASRSSRAAGRVDIVAER